MKTTLMIFDLTRMFGATVADYIYSLEQAASGSGVAWFRKLFPEDYYEYNAGELLSVEGVSAHITRNAGGDTIGNYSLDPGLTLRGIPKLGSNNKLCWDGDRYLPNGTVERKYGVVDLGTLTWETTTLTSQFRSRGISTLVNKSQGNYGVANVFCSRYVATSFYNQNNGSTGVAINNNGYVHILDLAYTDAAAFKAAMSGVYLVYELATPTIETAEPYRQLQVCDGDGTEEFVSTSIVPVGHVTRYPENLRKKIEGLPWNFNAIIAMTETTTTASKAYAAGDYFILNNALYRVTAAIAYGGTINPGTNCAATTIMDEIKSLA